MESLSGIAKVTKGGKHTCLPDSLFWCRNSICSFCPARCAKRYGVEQVGSPVAHITSAPLNTSSMVCSTPGNTTAAHNAYTHTKKQEHMKCFSVQCLLFAYCGSLKVSTPFQTFNNAYLRSNLALLYIRFLWQFRKSTFHLPFPVVTGIHAVRAHNISK